MLWRDAWQRRTTLKLGDVSRLVPNLAAYLRAPLQPQQRTPSTVWSQSAHITCLRLARSCRSVHLFLGDIKAVDVCPQLQPQPVSPSAPVHCRYLFDPLAAIAQPSQSVLDDCRDSLTHNSSCPPWSTWRRPRPTARRGSCLLLPRRPLRWHVEQTYVRAQLWLPSTDSSQYAYSAWAPQFADKLQLSTTQSNVIVRHPLHPRRVPPVLRLLGNSSEHGHVCVGHTNWPHHG